MPRPNMDIPNLMIGGVEDYAEREDISRDEAYAKLLSIGLSEEGILTEHLPEED